MYAKPAVGFTLPWAGAAAPAPAVKDAKICARIFSRLRDGRTAGARFRILPLPAFFTRLLLNLCVILSEAEGLRVRASSFPSSRAQRRNPALRVRASSFPVIPSAAEGPRILSTFCVILEHFWITLLPPAEALSAAEGEESQFLPGLCVSGGVTDRRPPSAWRPKAPDCYAAQGRLMASAHIASYRICSPPTQKDTFFALSVALRSANSRT